MIRPSPPCIQYLCGVALIRETPPLYPLYLSGTYFFYPAKFCYLLDHLFNCGNAFNRNLKRSVQADFLPPHAEVRSEYSRRRPGFLETPQKTPLSGTEQLLARSLTFGLGDYYFGIILGTLSATTYLVCIHFSRTFRYRAPPFAIRGRAQSPVLGTQFIV